MTRFWLGLWLLSTSWLFGLEYFSKTNAMAWAVFVALGAILIGLSQGSGAGVPPANTHTGGTPAETAETAAPLRSLLTALTLVLLIPAAIILSWPHRIAPLLMAGGALLALLPCAGRWLRGASAGATLSGVILFAQALALEAYKHGTARSHELPWPLPQLLAAVVRLLGVNAGADGSDLVLPTMRANHHLAATWDFFLDPATVCFVAGGLVVLALCRAAPTAVQLVANGPAQAQSSPAKPGRKVRESEPLPKRRWPVLGAGAKAAALLLLASALWTLLRGGVQAALLLHRALRTDYEAPLNFMDQFWSPWPHLLLLLPLALLAAFWLRKFPVPTLPSPRSEAPLRRPLLLATTGGFAAAAVLTFAVLWDPIGQRKPGRIAVDEFHSKWEPTQRPFDTEWYGHLSGYNYACLYDFCSRYYEMSRLTNSLNDAALAGLDALILKVPTEKYYSDEIDAIVRFVERGGGVLMVGEHTDVFGTGYHLNNVARRFGFTFRYDCLFGMESFFDQFYEPPLASHPVLGFVRNFDFATSCSLDIGGSSGRGVIVSTGLKNSMADYHANNYYPQAVDHPAMRSGAFVQLWSTRHGRGRVLAFTDSTIFSNFSTFEPGKIELFLGMLEWLNRRSAFGNPRPLLLVLGVALLLWSAFAAFKHTGARLPLVTAGVFGWSVTCLALVAHQRHSFPEPKSVRPCTWVTIDRTVCDGPLSKGGFIAGKADGFGIFERWILRLGCFIKRRSGPDALQGDLAVFLYPTKPVTREFREALLGYVERGGKVLVVDSPKNEKSTAAGLLEPFHLTQKILSGQGGALSGPAGWPSVPVEASYEIAGGQPLFRVDGRPVGAVARHGQGVVVALGFGSRFTDGHMGVTGDVEPSAELRKVFDLQFALVRAIITGQVEALSTPAN